MVARLRTLTAALVLLLAVAGGAAGEPSCLACHGLHYAEEGTCVRCHRGDDRTERADIAHAGLVGKPYAWFRFAESRAVRRGVELVEGLGCRRCHAVGGRGNGYSSDLDAAAATSSPAELSRGIEEPAFHMPDFRLAEDQVARVVTALLALGARSPPPAPDAPLTVHFEDPGGGHPFVRHCGGCHKALTPGRGGLGSGAVGPNLSGLLTPHYPVAGSGEPWTPDRLRKWIGNPRAVRAGAGMRPVPGALESVDAIGRALGAR